MKKPFKANIFDIISKDRNVSKSDIKLIIVHWLIFQGLTYDAALKECNKAEKAGLQFLYDR